MAAIDPITLRKWQALRYHDPRTELVELGRRYADLLAQGVDVTLDDLRVRELKKYIEQRQAALFAYLISHAVIKAPIACAMIEDEDYDCVFWWKVEGQSRYAPVQLKEVVSKERNANASINGELEKLEKYVTSPDLIVGVHVNQSGLMDAIAKPTATVREIWLYSSETVTQSHWLLLGNLLGSPRLYKFIPWPTS